MPDYGHDVAFGVSIIPAWSSLAEARGIAGQAEALGFDLIGIQDHPYQWRFLDTWMLLATLLAETGRIRVFPDVANLPLRGPAMIAKQSASLDLLSGGRFELGLGAGGFWEAIAAMGGPMRTARDAIDALEEAIQIIRLYSSAGSGGFSMPLVRIAFMKGKPQGFGRAVADVVYRTMVDTINVPAQDNFQVITVHDPDALVYDPSYLNIPRTDGVVLIQITLNEGRTVELKKAFYRRVAERLHRELGVRMEDVFLNLVEVKKENWSFGNGIAQYAE